VLHAGELHPLDVADDGEPHASHLGVGVRFKESMAVVVPPFEAFYEAHKAEVFRFLGRRLGRERVEDAFQETFLRALRAYPRLEHGEHLRAWVLTIASRIVVDEARRTRPRGEMPELVTEDGRPAFEELAPLTDGLPPKERAAVVLRYGYDLAYDEIGDALGSTESAARQAASAGVRRLRKEQK
jgi:RNA polymerase sigma factor (sigma-70 family)